jgi:flagellar protein FliO/FliZ
MMDLLTDLPDFVRMLVALVIVIAMMGGLALLLKKTGLSGAQPEQASAKRLRVLEKMPLDARRQLVLLQRDDVQHLVILSASGETVIETAISKDS